MHLWILTSLNDITAGQLKKMSELDPGSWAQLKEGYSILKKQI